MGWFFLRCQCDSGIAHRSQIQWLPDPIFSKKIRCQKLIRMQICQDPSFTDQDDPIHISP